MPEVCIGKIPTISDISKHKISSLFCNIEFFLSFIQWIWYCIYQYSFFFLVISLVIIAKSCLLQGKEKKNRVSIGKALKLNKKQMELIYKMHKFSALVIYKYNSKFTISHYLSDTFWHCLESLSLTCLLSQIPMWWSAQQGWDYTATIVYSRNGTRH